MLIAMWQIENKHRGFWFSEGAKGFFHSRWGAYGYQSTDGQRVYFVSSERFDWRSPRLYTVRVYTHATDDIDTVGKFQQYASRNGADKAAQRLAAQ